MRVNIESSESGCQLLQELALNPREISTGGHESRLSTQSRLRGSVRVCLAAWAPNDPHLPGFPTHDGEPVLKKELNEANLRIIAAVALEKCARLLKPVEETQKSKILESVTNGVKSAFPDQIGNCRHFYVKQLNPDP
jgi:hypothetical protein